MRNRAAETFDRVVRRMGVKYTPLTELPPLPAAPPGPVAPLVWHAQAMVPKVDLRDKDAVISAMGGE